MPPQALFIYLFLKPISMKNRHTNYQETRKWHWFWCHQPGVEGPSGMLASWCRNWMEQTAKFPSEESAGFLSQSRRTGFHYTCNSISLMAEHYNFHFKDDETETLWGSEKKPKITWFFSLLNRETNSIPMALWLLTLSFKLDPSSWPNIIGLFPWIMWCNSL